MQIICMGQRMTKNERKKLIIENALQIISDMDQLQDTRWKEWINRKIYTISSTVYQFYILKDIQMVMDLIKRVVELEIIRDHPLSALNMEKLSIDEIIKTCDFKYAKCGLASEKDKIFIHYEAEKAGDKYSNLGTKFTPDLSKYNMIVASHCPKALTKTDVINLVAACMFFSDFSDNEIKETLEKYFDRTGKLPSSKNLKYVSIIWGDINTKNRSVLSIPCSEMSFNNEETGEYYAFFNMSGESYVQKYSDEYFMNSDFSNFSEIYSEKIHGRDAAIHVYDKYYAFFA